MQYICSKRGQNIKSVTGQQLACLGCDGVMTVEGSHVTSPSIKGGFWSFPRKATAGFDCPVTIADPSGSELVEEM